MRSTNRAERESISSWMQKLNVISRVMRDSGIANCCWKIKNSSGARLLTTDWVI